MTDISREQALAHFGVKGMRWGVRKQPITPSTPKPRMSKKKKAAIAGGVLLAGAAVTAAILNKNGTLPISEITRSARQSVKDISRNREGQLWDDVVRDFAKTSQTVNRGEQTVKKLASDDKFKKLLKEFDADLARAHQEQTSWMLKNHPNYNPRLNPYVPESELQRLRTGRMLTTGSAEEFKRLYTTQKQWTL